MLRRKVSNRVRALGLALASALATSTAYAEAPQIKLHSGTYAHYTRLMFDGPTTGGYRVLAHKGTVTVTFNTAAQVDVSAIARFAPPWVKNATWRNQGAKTIVTFETDPDSTVHDFQDGAHVVLDVLAPKSDTAPETAKPVTGNDVTIHLPGAGQLPNAVFVRGQTAWVVVENPPHIDVDALKITLGSFATSVTATSGDRLATIRIGLKAPAQIGAHSIGDTLDIQIAPKVAPPDTAITLTRSLPDTSHAALTSKLALADHAFTVTDPVSGDMLTLVPTQTGSGMVGGDRTFADFAILSSASGLIVRPYTDDLRIAVDGNRVTINRPGGLRLTPSPQSLQVLAHADNGAAFLDFTAFARTDGKTFLARERTLFQKITHTDPATANPARLTLARFYLANDFAAEALGLIDLVIRNDPPLTNDTQITIMRAVAQYSMGRYRDAQTQLAGPQFDNNPHAALWRGLIEAALEDWENAYTHLDQAKSVMARYDDRWKAETALAQANAALELNQQDLAAAAMTHVPHTLTARQTYQAQLARARWLAGEGRYDAAAELFRTIENSRYEDLSAQAIFYHTDAALKAGTLSARQAITQLERLRWRWRGDTLELATLRKLGALYFSRNQWREGLDTLRIAARNFNGSGARMAQDDMRTTFAKLYLNGGADKMAPVAQLGLFYDNIDLTPIGPDGDAMIRRMADRLVAADLLGPAATLLAYQVDKRLDGIAKAQVATKLATLYLMDRKADKALSVIRQTQITGLPDDVIHTRLLLEARAFAALKQWDNALDLIAVDTSDDTKRLRADIYWDQGNWAMAGQAADAMLTGQDSETAPLSDGARALLLRATVAYALANDQSALDRLRTRFSAKMANTPDAATFTLLSQPIDLHGIAFREAAAKIASIDSLQDFMKDFSRRRARS